MVLDDGKQSVGDYSVQNDVKLSAFSFASKMKSKYVKTNGA